MASEEQVVTLTTPDGYALAHRLWRPAAPRGILLLSTGVMSHAGWWAPIAPRLVQAGLMVVGADRRGSGLNPVGRGDVPSAQTLVDDLALVRSHYAGPPLFVAGWCWGAVLSLAALPQLGEVAGLILLAPGLFPTSLIKERARALEADAPTTPEDAPLMKSPITDELFTVGPGRDFIAADPLALRAYSPRFRAAMQKLGFSAGARLSRLVGPTLLVLAAEDQVTDNAATQKAFARVGSLELAQLPGAHGLQFDAPEALAARMIQFCEAHLGPA